MSFPDPKQNQHCRLELNELISDYQMGYLTATGLLRYAVKVYRQDGHKLYIPSIDDFCEKLTLSKRSFFRAKANLVTHGHLEEEIFGSIALTTVGSLNAIPDTSSDNIGTQSARSGTDDATPGTPTPLEPLQDKGSSNPPDISQSVSQLSLSDLREEPLTVESTKVVGAENSGGERENFFSKKEISEASEEKSAPPEIEQDLNSSGQLLSKNTLTQNVTALSLSKDQEPRLKPKDSPSRGKGFGARSINEIKKKYPDEFPRLTAKLRQEGFPEEKFQDFKDYTVNSFKTMPKYPSSPDGLAMKRFSALMGDYLKDLEKKDFIAAAIEASKQQQAKPVEALDPEKEEAARQSYLKKRAEISEKLNPKIKK